MMNLVAQSPRDRRTIELEDDELTTEERAILDQRLEKFVVIPTQVRPQNN